MRSMRFTVAALFGSIICLAALAQATDDISDSSRKDGLAKAPTLIKTAGITCSVTDARQLPPIVPGGKVAGSKTGVREFGANGEYADGLSRLNSSGSTPNAPSPLFEVESSPTAAASDQYYEVACGEGLGYLVNATPRKLASYLCVELKKAVTTGPKCLLPGNSTAAEIDVVKRFLAKVTVSCNVVNVRGMGHNTRAIVVEAACSDGDGYVVQLANPPTPDKPVHAQNCLGLAPANGLSCQLTDTAAQNVAAASLLSKQEPACLTTAQRFVGMSTQGNRLFEFLCSDGQGYVLSESNTGQTVAVMACADGAVANLGGCKLSR